MRGLKRRATSGGARSRSGPTKLATFQAAKKTGCAVTDIGGPMTTSCWLMTMIGRSATRHGGRLASIG